jgi:hypothetical protein
MKMSLLPFLLFLMGCNVTGHKEKGNNADGLVKAKDSAKPVIHAMDSTVLRSKHNSDIVYEKSQKDTFYKIGDFLISGQASIKVDYIDKRKPVPALISIGDTLYKDKRFLILGDLNKMHLVYKKYYSKYKFTDFKVDSVYKGPLANPILLKNTNEWEFRTRIRERCRAEGVNFAGHHTLIEIRCGSACVFTVIVDRITGKVHMSDVPLGLDEGHLGVDFHVNSTMLIMNSGGLVDYSGYVATSYYKYPAIFDFKDGVFRKLE